MLAFLHSCPIRGHIKHTHTCKTRPIDAIENTLRNPTVILTSVKATLTKAISSSELPLKELCDQLWPLGQTWIQNENPHAPRVKVVFNAFHKPLSQQVWGRLVSHTPDWLHYHFSWQDEKNRYHVISRLSEQHSPGFTRIHTINASPDRSSHTRADMIFRKLTVNIKAKHSFHISLWFQHKF